MKKRYEISEHGPIPTPTLAQFEGYTVGQWCPTPDGTGPAVAVVISVDFLPGMELNGVPCNGIGLRLKSRKAINVLLEILERHRDEVFPQ